MYIHTDLFAVQTPKRPGTPCGDAYAVFRDEAATTILLADGLGSGIKAHIAANMCISRLEGLIRMGLSVREAFAMVAKTMNDVWGKGDPFAVFTIAKILNNGNTTVLSYEMPAPLIVNKTYCQPLINRVYTLEKAIIHEAETSIGRGDGLLLMSDGITQAGIGKIFPLGWETDGVRSFIQSQLPVERLDGEILARKVHDQAREYWPKGTGDDCSVLMAVNRRGVIVNLLTGTPLEKSSDEEWVTSFVETEGIHLVSGGSTAMMAARVLKKRIEVAETNDPITPPAYQLDGFELVTEGLVTLNQVYHLLDEDPSDYPADSVAATMAGHLRMADRINVWLGQAKNLNSGSIEFRQQGLLSRWKIAERIVSRLEEQGKLVVVAAK
ncbi:SpoIIE family protein phosphatase [Bacteroidales bacterium]